MIVTVLESKKKSDALPLGGCYHDNVVYGLGYNTGFSEVEVFGEPQTTLDRAEAAKAKAEQDPFWQGTDILIVAMSVSHIVGDESC